jgi:hypothetical protein
VSLDPHIAAGRVLAASEIMALSSGPVLNPEAFNYVTRRPEPGGLRCEAVFGNANWSAIAEDLSADLRSDRWGHVALDEPLRHPLRSDASVACVLVVPPRYRRWTRLPAEASRERARRRRAEVLATDEQVLGDPQENILFEEGLLDPADIDALGETWEEHPLDALYRAIVNRTYRARRLRELGAPADIRSRERDGVADATEALFRELVARREELGEENLLRALGMAST